jgi:hypothetical protein
VRHRHARVAGENQVFCIRPRPSPLAERAAPPFLTAGAAAARRIQSASRPLRRAAGAAALRCSYSTTRHSRRAAGAQSLAAGASVSFCLLLCFFSLPDV